LLNVMPRVAGCGSASGAPPLSAAARSLTGARVPLWRKRPR